MQLYKVVIHNQWGESIGYWRLTKSEVRTFRRKGTVTPITPEQVQQEKQEFALAAQEKQIKELAQ